jgi:hypothetical protein
MFPSFRSPPQCPVEPAVQQWIDSRMDWLVGQFGIDRLHTVEVILPTKDFFPDDYQPCVDDVRVILDRVCDFVEIDPTSVELHLYEDRNPHLNRRTAGLYEAVQGKYRIWVEANNLDDPLSATREDNHEYARLPQEPGRVSARGVGQAPRRVGRVEPRRNPSRRGVTESKCAG